ncbi:hypothetical protein [Micromonospora chokoriensis]
MTTEGAAGVIGFLAVVGIGYAIYRSRQDVEYVTYVEEVDDGDDADDVEEVWYEEWHYEERRYDD